MSNATKRKTSPTITPSPNRPILAPPQRPNRSQQQPAPTPLQAISPRLDRSVMRQSPPPLWIASSRLNSNVESQPAPNRFANRGPTSASGSQPTTRPVLRQQRTEGSDSELKLVVYGLPINWDTRAVHDRFKRYGTLVKIDIQEGRGNEPPKTFIVFAPPPQTTEWYQSGVIISNRPVRFHVCLPSKEGLYESPKDPSRKFAEQTKVSASDLSFGVMKADEHMLVLSSVKSAVSLPIGLELNLKRKCLDVNFAMVYNGASTSNEHKIARSFKMRLNFPQIRRIVEMREIATATRAWIILVDQPPLLFRKAGVIEDTHETGASFWNEWQSWYRQTEINSSPGTSRGAVTQLPKDPACIDIGRWLTYRLIFEKDIVDSTAFSDIRQALEDYDIEIKQDKNITFECNQREFLWSSLDTPFKAFNNAQSSSFSELHQLAEDIVHLPFDVRYQLEVCICHGILHECNINESFRRRLAELDPKRATKLLEKVADEKERFYNPEDIFRRVLRKTSIVSKPLPTYCAMIRAATITPTTIYFMTPVSETSNRIIRRFQHYEDRFLRVKFTDERYKGRVQSFPDSSMNEVYTRIKRTMTNGIRVGDRHYEFLAFGNSQFREHGAWFFAPTSDLTAQQIRAMMGDFSNIDIVAKYCSRMGQCFSTTRATRWSIDSVKIPDIKHNGFCFTDGVGKISPFLAQMIAQELGFPISTKDYPSAFQFRREGCKGILVVDPSLKNHTIQIRDSQEKFAGTSHRGLEVVRVSQFSSAYLNVQLILVLSALGVEDMVFVRMMRNMVQELKEAMYDEAKALELLQKNVDYNHMTVQLASMILDGFMETSDPFTISCLRLWRAWSIKYLKEKARIFVENGAFVLGCVDETATLQGYFKCDESISGERQDIASLPEIFLQIDSSGEGKWKVIEGICTLARNPSLHPGDVRVVRAVDVQALRHIRNCVVFPQTGDRDLGNMCSGGDLDGDDYLVMWDEDLMPMEWNHQPMDYAAASSKRSDGEVTVDDMTSFFVTHMKHDNLGPIAVAHRYWADQLQEGVKDPICMELAELHSKAVDYAKTGVPAEMPRRLRVKRWPHWCEPKNKPWYKSTKVLGQLYDEVQRVPFNPAWHLPFDQRILDAYTLDDQTLENAREVKQLYDTAVRRIMAKFSIENEFEIWTTFVLKHSDDMGDYKFAETIGEATSTLKDAHQNLCYEKAGTTNEERDWSKMGPFIAAMYTITAKEITAAMEDRNKMQLKGGQLVPIEQPSFENMPFMSFPWLFPAELGRIANNREDRRVSLLHTIPSVKPVKKTFGKPSGDMDMLKELKEVNVSEERGERSGYPERHDSPLSTCSFEKIVPVTVSKVSYDLTELTARPSFVSNQATAGNAYLGSYRGELAAVSSPSHVQRLASPMGVTCNEIPHVKSVEEGMEEETEYVTLNAKPSALDALERFMS